MMKRETSRKVVKSLYDDAAVVAEVGAMALSNYPDHSRLKYGSSY